MLWVSLFMYSKDFTCVLLVLPSKERSLEAFTIHFSNGCSNTIFIKGEIWKVRGKQEWIVSCPFWHSECRKTERFHSVSVACLLPFLFEVEFHLFCLWATELVTVFLLLWLSCYSNCEVVNKAMSKGEMKKKWMLGRSMRISNNSG